MSSLIVAVAILVGAAVLPALGVRAWAMSRLRSQTRGKLVLTYDDGPAAHSPTHEILEILRAHRARATFFVIGRSAEQRPETCDRMVADGHELGAHGWAHHHGWKEPVRSVLDVFRGVSAVARWRRGPSLYRPPFGKSTLFTLLAARACGARTVFWTIDSRDSWRAHRDLEAVVAGVVRRGGGVVLMHDFEREPGSPEARYTLDLTERLLGIAAQQRWTVCTVSELLGSSRRTCCAGAAAMAGPGAA